MPSLNAIGRVSILHTLATDSAILLDAIITKLVVLMEATVSSSNDLQRTAANYVKKILTLLSKQAAKKPAQMDLSSNAVRMDMTVTNRQSSKKASPTQN